MAQASELQAKPSDLADIFRAKLATQIDAAAVVKRLQEKGSDFVVLDVRDPEIYAKGHVEGALHVPAAEIEDRMDEIPRDKEVLVHCYDHECALSTQVCLQLADEGFQVKDILGGYEILEKKDAPIEKGEPERTRGKRDDAGSSEDPTAGQETQRKNAREGEKAEGTGERKEHRKERGNPSKGEREPTAQVGVHRREEVAGTAGPGDPRRGEDPKAGAPRGRRARDAADRAVADARYHAREEGPLGSLHGELPARAFSREWVPAGSREPQPARHAALRGDPSGATSVGAATPSKDIQRDEEGDRLRMPGR